MNEELQVSASRLPFCFFLHHSYFFLLPSFLVLPRAGERRELAPRKFRREPFQAKAGAYRLSLFKQLLWSRRERIVSDKRICDEERGC